MKLIKDRHYKIFFLVIPIAISIVLFVLSNSHSYSQTNAKHWTEPINISVLNSSEDDFAPSWNAYENLLFFNSTITGNSKFYTTYLSDSINFAIPKLIIGDLNSNSSNQSYITFLSKIEGYLTSYRLTDSRSYLNIYKTFYQKKTWTKPVVDNSLRFDAFAGHPTIAPDGSIMVFSSTRKSDKEDTDLWMAFRQENGTWGSIVALSELNTPGNEITPFLASKDTLYFASDGQEGPGGYDLFMSVYADGAWQRPFPLTELNTPYDESDLTVLPNKFFVFASSRPGGKGKLDLYYSRPQSIRQIENIAQDVEISLAAQVTTIQTKNESLISEFQISPIIFLDDNRTDNIKIINELNENNLPQNADSIYELTLSIMMNRLKTFPSVKLIFKYYYINEIDIEKSKSWLINKLKLFRSYDSTRIIIKSEKQLSNATSIKNGYFLIDSDEEKIFEPIESGDKNYTLSPSALDFSIDARPRETIIKWEASLLINDSKTNFKQKGTELPAQFAIDLKPFANEIANADSITTTIKGYDSTGRIYTNSNLMTISHKIVKEKKQIKLDNKIYNELNIIVTQPEVLEKNNSYRKIWNRINEYLAGSRSVSIQYIKTNQGKQIAEKIKNVIMKNNKIKIYLIPIDTFNNLQQADMYQSFVFRILFEK